MATAKIINPITQPQKRRMASTVVAVSIHTFQPRARRYETKV